MQEYRITAGGQSRFWVDSIVHFEICLFVPWYQQEKYRNLKNTTEIKRPTFPSEIAFFCKRIESHIAISSSSASAVSSSSLNAATILLLPIHGYDNNHSRTFRRGDVIVLIKSHTHQTQNSLLLLSSTHSALFVIYRPVALGLVVVVIGTKDSWNGISGIINSAGKCDSYVSCL